MSVFGGIADIDRVAAMSVEHQSGHEGRVAAFSRRPLHGRRFTLLKIAERRDNLVNPGRMLKIGTDDCLPDTREVCDDSRNQ